MLAYKKRGEPITPADMQAVFTAFENKLVNLLGGKSFILAFKNDGLNPHVPPQLLGKPIFFNDGKPTVYSQNVPGALTLDVNAADPVTGLPVTGKGVRSYDHSYFSAAAAASTVSTDNANKIRYIADVPQGAYPPGLLKLNAISIFEHSLDTHEDAQGFFLGELQQANGNGGGYFPTKRYEHACADLIIENLTLLNIPAAHDRKYACVRVHNLSLFNCTLTLSGHAVVIPPLGCVTIRRIWSSTSRSWESYRLGTYFFPIDSTDTCFFWHWPSLPNFVNPPAFTPLPVTCASAAQGNNVSNPAVLYDFVSALRWSPVTTNYAWLFLDVHELCDMGADFADHFPALKNTPDFPVAEKGQLRPDAKLFDLLAHSGRCELKKLRNPAQAQGNLISSIVFQYRGLKTLLADFAAAGITVATAPDGNYQFSKTEANYFWDLLPIGTNLLRWSNVASTEWDVDWQKLPYILELNRIVKIDPRILENGGLTNPFGTTKFTLRTQSDYRIAQRSLTAIARARQYVNTSGQLVTINGGPENKINLALGVPSVVGAVHIIGAAEFRDTLRFFGEGLRQDQSDAHVTYTGQRLTMTPNGLVLTFTEQVRGDIATWYTNSATPTAYAYAPIAGMETSHVRYSFKVGGTSSASPHMSSYFEAKHCVRFRKHGFPIAEFGKDFSHAYSAAVGRCTGPDYVYARQGPAGADAKLDKATSAGQVRQMRSLLITELSPKDARFWQPYAVDGWVAYDGGIRERYGEAGNSGNGWGYKFRSNFFQGATVGGVSNFGRCPMTTEGINSMIQLVNQCKTGRPLDYRCLRILVGASVLNFDFNAATQALRPWQEGFGNTPAPVQAFASFVPSGTHASHWSYWLAQNQIAINSGNESMPPSLAQYQNQWNETRVAESTTTARISDAAHSSNRIVNVNGSNYYYTVFSGRVSMEITDLRWSAPTQTEKGEAIIGLPGFMLVNRCQLNTAYTNQQWISLDSFKAFCARVSLPFVSSVPFVPLVLDTFELPSEFKRTPHVPSQPIHTYSGEIASCDGGGFGAPVPGPPNAAGIPLAVTKLNTLTDTKLRQVSPGQLLTGLSFGGPNNTKQIAFRLANADDTVEWKLPVATNAPPSLYWRLRERPEGGNRPNAYFVRHHKFAIVLEPQHHGPGNAALTIDGQGAGLSIRTGGYTQAAPWLPVGYAKYFPAGPGSVEGTDDAHRLAAWYPGTVEVFEPDGPRMFWDWKAPTDLEALRRAENYFSAINGEKYWIAWQITASAGLNATQGINLIPEPIWGIENSWWLRGQTEFLHGLFTFPGPVDPPLDHPFGFPRLITAGPGITLVQPNGGQSGQRVQWDSQQLVVAL
jgi:hypothetical protein